MNLLKHYIHIYVEVVDFNNRDIKGAYIRLLTSNRLCEKWVYV